MKITAKAHLNPVGMLNSVGVPNAQKIFATECARRMDKYVPMSQGVLKNSVAISPDGTEIIYQTPYARFQYHGKVMVGKKSRSARAKKGEKKDVTDKVLTYGGGRKRGPLWDARMWEDHHSALVKFVKKELKGGL